MPIRVETDKCDNCGEIIFDGQTYLFDEYFEMIFCDKRCHHEHYVDELDEMIYRHSVMYVSEMDEL